MEKVPNLLHYVQVVWYHWILCGVLEGDTSLRNGDEGQEQCVPPGVLRLSTVQPQVSAATSTVTVFLKICFQSSLLACKVPDEFVLSIHPSIQLTTPTVTREQLNTKFTTSKIPAAPSV